MRWLGTIKKIDEKEHVPDEIISILSSAKRHKEVKTTKMKNKWSANTDITYIHIHTYIHLNLGKEKVDKIKKMFKEYKVRIF